MVRLAPPPPGRDIKPSHVTVAAGTPLVRIYDPIHLGPATYNHNGPRGRFDHHAPASPPADDPAHGVYYAALTLAGCLVEVFGDTGIIAVDGHRIAVVEPPRPLKLLQLRGRGAWDAGTTAAVTKDSDRSFTQEWGRFFHTDARYGSVDGLSYANAHDDAQAYALFERTGSLTVVDDCPLADSRLEAEIEAIAIAFGMIVDRAR